MVPLSEIREPRQEPKGKPGGPEELKTIRGAHILAVLRSPGLPGLPSGSSLGSLELPQTGLSKALL